MLHIIIFESYLKYENPCKPLVYKGFRGRSEVIRTPDFFVPNEALYQTEPHPEILHCIENANVLYITRQIKSRVL